MDLFAIMPNVMNRWIRLACSVVLALLVQACGRAELSTPDPKPAPVQAVQPTPAPMPTTNVAAPPGANAADPGALFGAPRRFGPEPTHDEGPRRMITSADPVVLGDLQIVHGWGRPLTAGGTGAAYLTIQNSGPVSYTLTTVDTTAAASSELRFAKTITDSVTIAGGGTILLEPGGVYAGLLDVTETLAPGQVFTLTLSIVDESTGELPIALDVPIEIVPADVADTVATETP